MKSSKSLLKQYTNIPLFVRKQLNHFSDNTLSYNHDYVKLRTGMKRPREIESIYNYYRPRLYTCY